MKKKWLQTFIAVTMVVCMTACSIPAKEPVTDVQDEVVEATKTEKPEKEESKKEPEADVEVVGMAAPSLVTRENVDTPLSFN